MKAYWEGKELHAFLTSSLGYQLHAPAVLPAVPAGEEAGWALEPVWTRWRKETVPASRTPVVQPENPIVILTEPPRFLF
jgi:hypothetical protein